MVVVHVPNTVNRRRRLVREEKIKGIMLINRQVGVEVITIIIITRREEKKLLTRSTDEHRNGSRTTRSVITQVKTLADRSTEKNACDVACLEILV